MTRVKKKDSRQDTFKEQKMAYIHCHTAALQTLPLAASPRKQKEMKENKKY